MTRRARSDSSKTNDFLSSNEHKIAVKSKSSLKNKSKHRIKKTGDVRIIGGRFKRQSVPFIDAEGLRPSPDRLRETLFNWIQFELFDTSVLDICAGSGVLGLECLSRGAAHATFIELKSQQVELIKQTCDKFNLSADQFTIYADDALNVIPTLNPRVAYNFVFIDPPYDLELWTPLIDSLIKNQLVDSNSWLYIEDRRPLSETLDQLSHHYHLLKETKVGQIYASLIQIELN